MKRNQWIVIAVLVGVILGLVVIVNYIDGPRIVVRAVSPDGVEMCIIQSCNWGPEAFTTGFWYQKPGKPWGWFYYDHEDWFWPSGTVSLDSEHSTAVFYRDGQPAVTFDWTAERYTLHRFNRTLTGAQNWAPSGAPRPF